MLSYQETTTPETYTLSLHDALPISVRARAFGRRPARPRRAGGVLARGLAPLRGVRDPGAAGPRDRKSTRLNSSHVRISYAVFCLKKKSTQESMMQANHCSRPGGAIG